MTEIDTVIKSLRLSRKPFLVEKLVEAYADGDLAEKIERMAAKGVLTICVVGGKKLVYYNYHAVDTVTPKRTSRAGKSKNSFVSPMVRPREEEQMGAAQAKSKYLSLKYEESKLALKESTCQTTAAIIDALHEFNDVKDSAQHVFGRIGGRSV